MCESPARLIAKWSVDIFNTKKLFILSCFTNVYKITISTKLRNCKYQILQRTLVLNPLLYKLNIKQTENCTICKNHNETIVHIFFNCEKVQLLWERLFHIIWQLYFRKK